MFPLVTVVIMIYYMVAVLRGWDSHVVSAGQAEEEAGSFRNLFVLASALAGEEAASLLESPEGVQGLCCHCSQA